MAYNAVAFPLAAGVLYPFVLSPEVAAISMSGSTLIVAVNALMLKRLKFAGNGPAANSASSSSSGKIASTDPAIAIAPSEHSP